MKSLDELMADKIYELVNYMLAKKIKPDISLDKVTALTEADIKKLKEKLGIEGVILDIDDSEITLPDGEAVSFKWVTIDEFEEMFNEGKIVPSVDFDRSDFDRAITLI